MAKRFVFVNLSINSGYFGPNFGICNLVPIIREFSYHVEVIQLTEDISEKSFRKVIEDLKPSLIGYSFTSPQLKYFRKYSNAVKNMPDIMQIAGGVGPTLAPEQVLSNSCIDGLVVGEGEIPVRDLLERLESGDNIHDTEGFYWRVDGEIKKNPIPGFVKDLSTLDFPDFSVFDRSLVVLPESHTIRVLLARGCPYACTYCCNNALRSRYDSMKRYFRVPTVEYCIELLSSLKSQYPEVEFIDFQDDLLISVKDWFRRFSEEYEKKIKLPCAMNIRAESVDADIVKALKNMNCTKAHIGLESGSEFFRKEYLNRNYSNDLLIEKVRMVQKAGIELATYNIVGFPFETTDQMRETLELNKTLEPDGGICSFFYPFPGTELYDVCVKEGLLFNEKKSLNITNYNRGPVIRVTNRRGCIHIQRQLVGYFAKKKMLLKYHEFNNRHPKIFSFIAWIRTRLFRVGPETNFLSSPFLHKIYGRLRKLILKA